MKRREFVAALGATAVGTFAARAQPAPPVIGFLSARSPVESAGLVAAFRRGLAQNGTIEGLNVAIDYRWALGEYDRLPAMALELVHRPVAVFVTVGGEASVRAAMAATKNIPIIGIFADDPIANPVSSPAWIGREATPPASLTSITTLEAKRLGLLHELVPQAATVGVLVNPNYPPAASQLKGVEEAARTIGLGTLAMRASNDGEIEAAFESVIQQRIRILAVTSDPFFNTRSDRLVALAARHAVPTVYPFREYAAAGGLMSYGVDLSEMYRQVGIYAGQVVKGVKPADLPIMQPIKFELVINVKTAKTLGLTIPSTLLASADEVIE